MNLSNPKGITLISMVITIIVIIIITGVTIKNVVGENNSIDKAEYAKNEEELKSKNDEIQYIISKYNSNSFVGSSNFGEFLSNQLSVQNDVSGKSKLFTNSDNFYYQSEDSNQYILKYSNQIFRITEGSEVFKLDDIKIFQQIYTYKIENNITIQDIESFKKFLQEQNLNYVADMKSYKKLEEKEFGVKTIADNKCEIYFNYNNEFFKMTIEDELIKLEDNC